jgi:hypothetical protein
LRKTQGAVPRDPLDNHHHACDENMALGRNMIYEFQRLFRVKSNIDVIELINEITLIIRFMNHLELVEIRNFNYEMKNRDLRIRYLINEIGEEEMKKLLQQAEKKHNKLVEVNDIYRMVLQVVGDILNRFLRYLRSNPNPEKISMEIFDELDPLKKYANECLIDIKHTYGSQFIRIFGDRFELNRYG